MYKNETFRFYCIQNRHKYIEFIISFEHEKPPTDGFSSLLTIISTELLQLYTHCVIEGIRIYLILLSQLRSTASGTDTAHSKVYAQYGALALFDLIVVHLIGQLFLSIRRYREAEGLCRCKCHTISTCILNSNLITTIMASVLLRLQVVFMVSSCCCAECTIIFSLRQAKGRSYFSKR